MKIITQRRKLTLKEARLKKGLSQEEVSLLLGFTPKTYIQYEKYRRVFRIDDAIKFSEITEVPIDNLIFFEY